MHAKDVEVKARITSSTRQRLEKIADTKGEALSVVVREAVNEYLERHDTPLLKKVLSYSKEERKKKKSSK